MSFMAILEVLNFDFSKFEQLSSPKFTKNSKFWASKFANNGIFGQFEFTKIQSSESKIDKTDIFGPFEFAKIWFHIKSEWQ